MIRPLDMVLALLVVGGAASTYTIKHDAEDAADRVSALQRRIAAEEERIVFLRADWAYLNAPARLERLVKRFGDDLALQTVEAHQWVAPDDLPPPPEADEDEMREAALEDDFATGSVRPAPRSRPRARPRPPRPLFGGDAAPSRPRRAAIPSSIDDLLRSR